MACDAQKQAVIAQNALVKEIMAATNNTANTMRSQLQTLTAELAILETRYNEYRTCMGG